MEACSGACSWIRAKRIGEGSFGVVDLAVTRSDGGVFAVKSVDRRARAGRRVEALENEIGILRRLSSPYVVRYLGDDVSVEEGGTSSFRNLHVEYLPGGTVADLARRSGGYCADVEERIVRSYAYCVVEALRYVHSKGLVHCDVKGRNVLVGAAEGEAKLIDFGAARGVSGEICGRGGAILPRGSPLWMAPEVIRGEYQGPESDVWSLGCTVIEMVSGKPAWEDCGVDTIFRIGFSDDLPEFPPLLSELGRDFLSKCLKREPAERWSCDDLLQHPFLSSSSPESPSPNSITRPSPRSVLDCFNFNFSDDDDEEETEPTTVESQRNSLSPKHRLQKLASNTRAVWESEEGWTPVRSWISDRPEGERTISEYPKTRVTPSLDNSPNPGREPGSTCRYGSLGDDPVDGEESGVHFHSHCKLLLYYSRILGIKSLNFDIYMIYLEVVNLIIGKMRSQNWCFT